MKKIGWSFLILVAVLLLAAAGAVYYLLLGQWHGTAYAAGKTNFVKVYTLDEAVSVEPAGAESSSDQAAEPDAKADTEEVNNDSTEGTQEAASSDIEAASSPGGPRMIEAGNVIRGSEVTTYLKTVEVDGVIYRKVEVALAEDAETSDQTSASEQPAASSEDSDSDDGLKEELNSLLDEAEKLTSGGQSGQADLYMIDDTLAASAQETVLEREVYVRTPATIYAEPDSPAIASFAPKGTHLDITGYDRLLPNGYINKYKVAYTDADGNTAEGYVYGKYMTDTQEAADAPYNEHGEYDAAKGDKFGYELYGGKATDVDLYPYERTRIEGNDFCTYARAMYINAYAATHPEQYVKLIKASGCNAVVIDLKDGPLTYKSEVAKELSPTSYKHAYFSEKELKKGIDAYREAGCYLIGRIVTFNDPNYAKDHPEDCIKYQGSAGWPSAFSRDVWEYNVRLAQEAVEKFDLNEIQFDYVRFPESTYQMSKSGKANFRNKYKESKVQAVQNFCFYAADQLRESGAYISVDVFGESAYSYVTAYGQYWTSISNIVDAISAMPYTDHFSGDQPWADPYKSVRRWAKRAEKQQKRLQDPAVARTWITGYNTPHWAPSVNYDTKKLKQQVNALEKSGLTGGFIPWNASSDITKYREYKGVWKEQ